MIDAYRAGVYALEVLLVKKVQDAIGQGRFSFSYLLAIKSQVQQEIFLTYMHDFLSDEKYLGYLREIGRGTNPVLIEPFILEYCVFTPQESERLSLKRFIRLDAIALLILRSLGDGLCNDDGAREEEKKLIKIQLITNERVYEAFRDAFALSNPKEGKKLLETY